METFYDGDLKDIWDSDLDPSDSLKISTDHEMHDWFLERDVKDPAVILNDKLISDALLNGTLPIKSEHSYSLNSDGDSLPNSPRSLHTKMDDMDDECYPAISLKTATSNLRNLDTSITIDPKCLILQPATSTAASASPLHCSPLTVRNAMLSNSAVTTTTTNATSANTAVGMQTSIFSRFINGGMTLSLPNKNNGLNLHTQQYLPQSKSSAFYDQDCNSSSSTRDGSISPDICSDIEIDESCIKDEPLSPESSCPPSPSSHKESEATTAGFGKTLSLSMTQIMGFNANTDLVYDPKHGCIQLATTSHQQNLLKSQQQQILQQQQQQQQLLGQNIAMPKISIKSEKQHNAITSTTTSTSASHATSTSAATVTANNNKNNGNAYGIPLTPPSSLPSDESEGNLTPEHLFSPLSPTTSVSISVATNGAANGNSSTCSLSSNNSETNTRRANNHNSNNCNATNGRNVNTATTRQPIHTPLISSQPKGSTGNLLLTEEEKRTLLAEGYPIPQKLPLTKAEEKSLKKIRRKIKNKISAQESRRKKKEYMDQLERRVEILVNENNGYRKRVESLEDTNANLLSQLQKLQALVNKNNIKRA